MAATWNTDASPWATAWGTPSFASGDKVWMTARLACKQSLLSRPSRWAGIGPGRRRRHPGQFMRHWSTTQGKAYTHLHEPRCFQDVRFQKLLDF
jgi:hypothetical protein